MKTEFPRTGMHTSTLVCFRFHFTGLLTPPPLNCKRANIMTWPLYIKRSNSTKGNNFEKKYVFELRISAK